MLLDDYTKKDMLSDFKDISEHIYHEDLQGAEITSLIDEVFNHYEVATRLSLTKSKGHYRDLLIRLVKNYGH